LGSALPRTRFHYVYLYSRFKCSYETISSCTWLARAPENIKWVHQVYQAILMSGLMGLELLLLNFALSNLKIETWYLSFIGFIGILIPIISVTAKKQRNWNPIVKRLYNKKTGVLRNLTDRYIEIYYITKTLELIKQKKKE